VESANALHVMQGEVLEAARVASLYHMTDAMRPLRERMEAVCPPDVLAAQAIAAAPVIFRGRTFDIDDEGAPAVVAIVSDAFEAIEDLAAFAPDGPRHALMFGRGTALGLGAFHDWRFHEHLRIAMHAGVWSYLGAQGRGLLPLNWRRIALELIERRIEGVVATSVAEGREIERRLCRALKPPSLFIKQQQEAA